MLHAHQGHPDHDSGERDGADRQDVAGLLRRRVRGGQLRHRRVRPGDGPERRGAVLGAEPDRSGGDPVRPLRPRLRRAGGTVPATRADVGPARPRRSRTSRTCTRTARSPRSARSSRRRPTRTARSRSTSGTVINAVVDSDHETLERWAGMADADTSVVVDAHLGGYPVSIIGIESRPIPRRGYPAGGRARTSSPRARCSRGRARRPLGRSTPPRATGRWWCWRTCPGSTAPRSRCGTSSWSTAPRSAERSSTSDGPIIFCRGLPLPRRRVRGVLRRAQRQHGGGRGRGLVRVGHRRRAGRGRRVHPGREHPHRQRPADQGAGGADRGGRRRGAARASCGSSSPICGRRSASEKLGEVANEFEQIHNIERALEVGSVHTIIPAVAAAAVPDRGRRARNGADGRRAGGVGRHLIRRLWQGGR